LELEMKEVMSVIQSSAGGQSWYADGVSNYARRAADGGWTRM